MSLEPIAAPSGEPVSLDEAKAYLRVDHDDEDALILRLVASAREWAERYTGRAFLAQSWRLWRDAWPECNAIEIPRPPLVSVTSVAVYDRSGAATVLSSDAYIVDASSAPGRLVFKDTTAIPVILREANALSVDFDAGYGAAADVPAAIRNAILMMVAGSYEARGEGAAPMDAIAALAPFRVPKL